MAHLATAHSIPNSSVIDIQSHRPLGTTNNHSQNKNQNNENEFEINSEESVFQKDGTYGVVLWPVSTNKPALEKQPKKPARLVAPKKRGASELKGLKKRSLKKAKELDMPPTPTGHDWHVSEEGWNLVKSWTEKEGVMGQKVKKERYAGYLSRQAWQVMKEYEYEKVIAQIGQSGRYGRS